MNLENCIQKIKKINTFASKEWWGIPRIFLIIFFCLYVPMWLATIFVAQPIVEKGYSKYFQLPVLGSDSYEYQTLGDTLIMQGAFSFDRGNGFESEVFRTPGYPLFVALVKFIYTSSFAVTFLQLCLAVLSALLIHRLADQIMVGSGKIAGTLYMLLPGTIFHSLVIMSDTLFVFLLLLLVYIVMGENSYKKTCMIGVILACLAFIRPIAQFLIPCVVVFICIDFVKCKDYKRASIHGLIIILISMSMMVPWMYRNYIISGSFGFSSVTAFNSLTYNIGGIWKGSVPVYEAAGLKSLEEGFQLQNSEKITKFVTHEFFSQFRKYLGYHFSATHSFFFSTGMNLWDVSFANYGRTLVLAKLLIILEKVFWIGILGLFVVGVYWYRKNTLIIVGLLLVMYFCVLTGPVAYARYRMPVEPFLLIGASVVLVKIKKVESLGTK